MYARAKTFTLSRPKLKKTVGWVFVVVGVVAIVVPVIPGAPLVFVGLELVGFKLLILDKFLGRNSRVIAE